VSTDPNNMQPLDDDALKQAMDNALEQAPAKTRKSGHREASRDAGPGSRIQGRVVSIREPDVFVDYGGKSEGFLPLDEFDGPPEIGQVFEFIPHGFDRDSGQMRLSLRDVKLDANWESIQVGDVIEGRVTGANIGGLELNVHGLRAFMPKSQVDVDRHDDFGHFVGRKLEAEVIEVNRKDRNLLISHRKVLEKRLQEVRDELKSQLEPGQIKTGTVKRLTDFGAFVDIGGLEGLLHVSDISYTRIGHPKEVLKVGDEVQVQILKINQSKDRISLGMKQLATDPWTLVEGNYRVGSTVEGKVTRLADFGAFVELEPGIEGLIPMSEMSWTQRIRHPKDVLSEGDSVRVSILSVDPQKRRISLSLKALTEDPWQDVTDKYAPDAVVKGAVTRTTDFGAFVQLDEGVEGLVHISELSPNRVRAVTDVVKQGDVVECKVLGVDPGKRRISLSVKQAQEAPPAEAAAPPPRKKRDKPLRGGLTW
jgi:small subunit ribosomal protein S1